MNTSAIASSSYEEVAFQDNELKITVIEDEETYSLTRFEDVERGTVEYLETTIIDGEMTVLILNEDKELSHTIDVEDDKILLDGQKIGDITEEETFEFVKHFDNQARVSSWTYISTTYGSSTWKIVHGANMVVIIAGVLSKLTLVGAGSSVLIGIATNMVTFDRPITYWKRHNWVDSNANYRTCKTAKSFNFYRYSNHTGGVGNVGLRADYIDPCNSGY